MTPEQQAAFVHAQSVAASAEIEGMKAENTFREMQGKTIAYDSGAFLQVIEEYFLRSNALIDFFRD